jgi:hypothetical protein
MAKKTPEERADINRKNAEKSTGPRSAEGKKRSSLNARRHGLTNQFFVEEAEDRKARLRYTRDLYASFDPKTREEEFVVQRIADNMWQIQRFEAALNNSKGMLAKSAIEKSDKDKADDFCHPAEQSSEMALATSEHKFFFQDEGFKTTESLTRQIARLERNCATYRKELRELKKERKKEEKELGKDEKAENEAKPKAADYYDKELKKKDIGEATVAAIQVFQHTIEKENEPNPQPAKQGSIMWMDPLYYDLLTEQEQDAYDAEMYRRLMIKRNEPGAEKYPNNWVPPGCEPLRFVDPESDYGKALRSPQYQELLKISAAQRQRTREWHERQKREAEEKRKQSQ